MAAKSSVVLYTAWFCPYAQRAWMALNLYGVPYKRVEALQLDDAKLGYVKDPALLAVNPKGLVPTLDATEYVGGGAPKVVKESLDTLLWVRAAAGVAAPQEEKDMEDMKRVNDATCSAFYKVLMAGDEAAWARMLAGLESFVAEVPEGGFHAAGGEGAKPGVVDLALFPWVHRLFILEEFRGLTLPDAPWAEGLRLWEARMAAVPAVRDTLADRDELIGAYKRYAENTAKSKVADAVRKGNEAHEHD